MAPNDESLPGSDPDAAAPSVDTVGPLARADVVFRQLGDEWVLFDPDAYRLHVLNLTAALVWTHCDGTYDVPGLVNELEGAFDAPPPSEQLAAEVEEVLEGFRKEGLLR